MSSSFLRPKIVVLLKTAALLVCVTSCGGGGGSETSSTVEPSASVNQQGQTSNSNGQQTSNTGEGLASNSDTGQGGATATGDSFSVVFLSDPQFFRHVDDSPDQPGFPRRQAQLDDPTGTGGNDDHFHWLTAEEAAKDDPDTIDNERRCFTTRENLHRHEWEPQSKGDCQKAEGDSTDGSLVHWHSLPPETTKGGAECYLGGVRRRKGLCDSVATNEAVVHAVSQITELDVLPADWECSPDFSIDSGEELLLADGCLLQGSGTKVTKPAVVVVNGDLTESSSSGLFLSQVGAFDEIYAAENFEQPLLLGLGNHDYKGASDNHRDAVERMSNELDNIDSALKANGLNGLANHDMQGVVHLRNNTLRRVRFKIRGDCSTSWVQVGSQQWGRRTVGQSCRNVSVIVQQRTSGGILRKAEWTTIDDRFELNDPVTNICLQTSAKEVSFRNDCQVSINPGVVATDSRRRESERKGSMSYSFDIENYHFVQLHFALGYEEDFREQKRRLQGFKITSALAWLKNDLLKAANQGKVSVINVHAIDEKKFKHLKNILKEQPGFNVIAVFAGHLHNQIGRTKAIPVKQGEDVVRRIPVFRTGSGSCGTMIYADFQNNYFNWTAIRAWTDGSQDAEYVRPGLKIDDGNQAKAIADPMFIEDETWNCHGNKKPFAKFGTIDFSALLDREPVGEPPIAVCRDVEVETNDICEATANIDNGSYDPEGGMVFLSQDLPGPYGPGAHLVTLNVLDEEGNSARCDATVTVVDKTEPSVLCNVPAVTPPDAPISITAIAEDNCSVSEIALSEPDCYKINGAGKRVDLNQACKWDIFENTLTIHNTGGVGTRYDWLATAIDENGNASTAECELEIENPGNVE